MLMVETRPQRRHSCLSVSRFQRKMTILKTHANVVAILDAGRNALSFFMLLVVSLGLSVVKETLGSTMTKCTLLAIAHFIFGGLFSSPLFFL